MFLKHVFILIIIFQRINHLPLISTISLIREVILLNFSFLISLTKNVSFYCFLFQSCLRQSYSFFGISLCPYGNVFIPSSRIYRLSSKADKDILFFS